MKPVLITANGTAVPDGFGPGFSGDVGRAFMYDPWNDLAANIGGVIYDTGVYWQPIGYPAQVFPMRPSVEVGRNEVNRQIAMRPKGTPLFFSGYSQSAVLMAEVWVKDILSPNGIHHDRLPDVRGIIQFGDPVRCPGIANGNQVAGLPMPKKLDGQTTGGIAGPTCIRANETPDFYLSCALDGDLYACAPVGDSPWDTTSKGGGENEPEVGQIETRIYEFVMSGSLIRGFLAICEGIAEEFSMPVSATIAHFQAIANGLKFAAAGQAAPHWLYGPFVPAMCDWIKARI